MSVVTLETLENWIKGICNLLKNLKIIGTSSNIQLNNFPGSFYSISKKLFFIKASFKLKNSLSPSCKNSFFNHIKMGNISMFFKNLSDVHLIWHVRTCAYQGVRNVRFLENLACFVFLKYPFWDSPFRLITNDLFQLQFDLMIDWYSQCIYSSALVLPAPISPH